MQDEILQLSEEYNRLLDKKDELAEAMRANNLELDRCRTQLADKMLAADLVKFSHDGYGFTAVAKTKYSKRAGADNELFRLLRTEGLGDLIKETVNANSLNAAMGELAEENDGELPEAFADVLNVYNYTDILRRKSK